MNLENLLVAPPLIKFVHSHQRLKGKTPIYCASNVWALNIYNCSGKINFPDTKQQFKISKGDICLLPSGLTRQFDFSTSGRHRVVIFNFSGTKSHQLKIPLIVSGGRHYKKLVYLYDELLFTHSAGRTERAACQFWNLMWLINDLLREKKQNPDIHLALRRAIEFITPRLRQKINTAEVVQASGISHNQLNRLFADKFNNSIIRYIHTQRMQEAEGLLLLTDIPIKEIAIESGIADLQKFNKAFRKTYGICPRRYREEAKIQ